MKMGKSVFETFEQTVENAGDKTALIFLGEKYSYRFLKKASERLATAFVKLGIKKGDVIELMMPSGSNRKDLSSYIMGTDTSLPPTTVHLSL